MSKHAYLIMAHDNYQVLRHALSLIDDQRNVVFLMVDQKSKNFESVSLKNDLKLSPLLFLPRIEINWAGYSMIRAMLALIKTALEYKESFNYLHFLQGADLPVKSQDHIHAYFDQNQGKEFIDFSPRDYQFAKYKKCYYHLFVDNKYYRTNKAFKGANHLLARMQKMVGLNRCSGEIIYHGSALFSITADFAGYVISKDQELEAAYKHTLGCDEVFLQSMIMQSAYSEQINAFEQSQRGNARFFDLKNSEQKNSPRIFTINDYDLLMSLEEYICFARKFSEHKDLEVVGKIHRTIKGYDL